jgi:D-alanine-D-alanine ligase
MEAPPQPLESPIASSGVGASPSVKKFKVAVLQPSYQDSSSVIKDLDYARNLKAWLPADWQVEHVFVHRRNVVAQIREAKADVYVNLCDGAWDEDSPGIDVVLALERFKKAFTGAPSRFYDPTKEAMKKVCYYWDIGTARHTFAYTMEDVALAARTLSYPMFVKHFHGYNSVGITEKSKVSCQAELEQQAAYFIDTFGGALIEEFIDGREFSCLVCSNPKSDQDPILFHPVECVWEPHLNFKTFAYKWSGAKNPWKKVEDAALAERLEQMTKQLYIAMHGQGYARTDIRMDAAGKLYLLEINPNPSIFYPDTDGATADTILLYDGYGKANFLRVLIDHAIARQKKESRNFQVIYDPQHGLRTHASRDIEEGELIFEHEEQNQRIVSRHHVQKNWNSLYKKFADEYCFPITENIWGMWDDDPDSWKPLSHSREPNSWFEGLNIIARKLIRKGEVITLDYATLYAGVAADGSPHGAFECDGTWSIYDYREQWFKEKYGHHVSDYVRQMQSRSSADPGHPRPTSPQTVQGHYTPVGRHPAVAPASK